MTAASTTTRERMMLNQRNPPGLYTQHTLYVSPSIMRWHTAFISLDIG